MIGRFMSCPSVLMQVPWGVRLAVASNDRQRCSVPASLLCSAFGETWQQTGFKVQLSVFKDSARIAGVLTT
jgi:hypothetical protein